MKEKEQQLKDTFNMVSKPFSVNDHKLKTTVLLGDPRLPDPVKLNGQFNQEDIEMVDEIKSSLALLTEFEFTYLDDHKNLLTDLQKSQPQFVFNLCDEGFNNLATHELHVPALLELMNIPYTGAGPACLALCFDKSAVRAIAQSLNIPVPNEAFVMPLDGIPSILQFPVIIKPNVGDGSIGITQNAVVHNQAMLEERLQEVQKLLPNTSMLIQEYLTGPEYSVGILGNPGNYEVLPLLEVDFSTLPSHLPKILAYEQKWQFDSDYYTQIKFKGAELPAQVENELIAYSFLLFERLGCRDFARFDFRADANGTIKLLEANPNPSGLSPMADLAGITYEQLFEKVLHAAMARYR